MPEASPHVTITQHKDITIVDFLENKILDESNIHEIGQQLKSLIEGRDRPKLLVDFSNVDHLSSRALGELIDLNKRILAQSGQLRLANIKAHLIVVFQITKLDRVFKILPTRQEALGSYN